MNGACIFVCFRLGQMTLHDQGAAPHSSSSGRVTKQLGEKSDLIVLIVVYGVFAGAVFSLFQRFFAQWKRFV